MDGNVYSHFYDLFWGKVKAWPSRGSKNSERKPIVFPARRTREQNWRRAAAREAEDRRGEPQTLWLHSAQIPSDSEQGTAEAPRTKMKSDLLSSRWDRVCSLSLTNLDLVLTKTGTLFRVSRIESTKLKYSARFFDMTLNQKKGANQG